MAVARRATRQVGVAPLPGARLQAAETPLSTGVGVEQAKARTHDAAANLAAQGAGIAIDLVREERQNANEVALLKASNQLAAWKTKRLYDPTDGALTLKGEAAMPLPEQITDEFNTTADAIAAGLGNREQRDAFTRMRAQAFQQTDLEIRRHVFGEMQEFRATELKAAIDHGVDGAIRSANDPGLVGLSLQKLEQQMRVNLPKLGVGPDGVEVQVAAVRSQVHLGVINQYLAQGEDRKASAYFSEAKGEIAAADLDHVTATLDAGSTAGTALRASEDLWTRYGPKGEHDPINLDQMETAARERFADEPKVLKATIQELRERKAGVDASRADRTEQGVGTIWKAVASGATLAQVRKMPEYLNASGTVQTQVSEHLVSEAEHKADRSYTLGQRGKESEAAAQNALERKTWAQFWEYSDPQVLSQMSENQILALTPTLGVDHVNRLMAQKRTVLKSDDQVRAATIDDDLFKGIAQGAGFNPYGAKQSDDEKASLGHLKSDVETAIDAEQVRAGKLLTRDQKTALMQSIVDRTVFLNQWGTDPETTAAGVVNKADQASAYVPLARIRPQHLQEWVNAIRTLVPGAQQYTKDEILRRYTDRIQKAHAAAMMGLGAEEEQRRLLGP